MLTDSPANSQWLSRAKTSGNNWSVATANNGVLFNDGPVGGAVWSDGQNNQSLIFGCGLWIGGKIYSPISGQLKSSTITFDPSTGQGDFCPGSLLFNGAHIDSGSTASEKYRVYESSTDRPEEWPMRLVQSTPTYIDNITDRSLAGQPSYIGDEDLFSICKNTDTGFFTLWHKPQPISHFEIRTQIGTWHKGLGADVVIVKNKIIYLDTNTLYDPVVALAIDPDLPVIHESSDHSYGFLTDSISGCMVSAFDAVPALGIFLLRGFSFANYPDAGMTGLHQWSISTDPPSRELRYDFMVDTTKDLTSQFAGDLRIMISSKQSQPLHSKDTISFDYALFAFQPEQSGKKGDTASLKKVIETGKIIKNLYDKSTLNKLDAKNEYHPSQSGTLSVYPQPSQSECTIMTDGESIKSIHLFDVSGREIRIASQPILSESKMTLSTSSLPQGFYTLCINNHLRTKLIVRKN
ncbi:MAG: T9SS type A sorting domain-containing protein [Ignavibacteriota bacterium]